MYNLNLSNKGAETVAFYAAKLYEGFLFILLDKDKHIRLIVFAVFHVMCVSTCCHSLRLVFKCGIKSMQINLPSHACFLI